MREVDRRTKMWPPHLPLVAQRLRRLPPPLLQAPDSASRALGRKMQLSIESAWAEDATTLGSAVTKTLVVVARY